MFPGTRSITLMRIGGIRVSVDGTWFIMLFVLIFLLSGSFRSALGSSDGVAYLTTVATVLLFFGSLVLHELGHAVAARREGIVVLGIELFLFGGVTRMSRDTRTPGEEFRVAVAGPIGTLVFVVICLAVDLAIVGPHRLLDAVLLRSSVPLTPVLLSLSWLVPMNVLILLFNLVPAYPLDGGRLLRAAVWQRTGDKQRGTVVASVWGERFAVVLGLVGVWLFISYRSFTGIWLLVLAFLLGQSARATRRQAAVTARIDAVRVRDIMDHEPVAIPDRTPIEQALNEYILRYDATWLPVIDSGGRFLGIARRERAQEVADRVREGADRGPEAADGSEAGLTVSAALDPDPRAALQVDEDRTLTDLLSLEPLGRLGGVVAVDADGLLRGIVTLEAVRRALGNVFPAHG